MKNTLILIAVCVLSMEAIAKGGHSGGSYSSSGGSHAVSGYTTKSGTYVAPTHATNPNATKADNYSTKGNVTPANGNVAGRVVGKSVNQKSIDAGLTNAAAKAYERSPQMLDADTLVKIEPAPPAALAPAKPIPPARLTAKSNSTGVDSAVNSERQQYATQVQVDVKKIADRAAADYPYLTTPAGTAVMERIVERRDLLIEQGVYPSIALTRAVNAFAAAYAPYAK